MNYGPYTALKDTTIQNTIPELNELRKQTDKELLLDKRSDWIDWVGKHHKDVNDYMKVTDTKTKRRILDIFVNKVRVNYLKETQQHII